MMVRRRAFNVDPAGKDGYLLYGNPVFSFEDGVTCLVGCNGSGKTTLMERMQKILKDLDIPYKRHYDKEAKGRLESKAMMGGARDDIFAALDKNFVSEGESISYTLGHMAKEIGKFVFHTEGEELWIFFDSMDSGLSVDAIGEVADLLDLIVRTKPEGIHIYIVMAVNSFEFAWRYDCVDVQTAEHVKFEDYEDYRDFIFHTREVKDQAEKAW